jgi:hypothetical protein
VGKLLSFSRFLFLICRRLNFLDFLKVFLAREFKDKFDKLLSRPPLAKKFLIFSSLRSISSDSLSDLHNVILSSVKSFL